MHDRRENSTCLSIIIWVFLCLDTGSEIQYPEIQISINNPVSIGPFKATPHEPTRRSDSTAPVTCGPT